MTSRVHRASQVWTSPRVAVVMALGFALLIVAVSSIPARQMPQSPGLWRWDKVVHGFEYAVFAALVFRALMLRGHRLMVCALASVVVCSLFGALDESYQSTVPGRDSSGYDAIADSLGAAFACIASVVVYSRTRRHQPV